MDEFSQIAISPKCSSCHSFIGSTSPTGTSRVQTKYHNEGGVQDDLDIFPLVIGDAYLDANPTARPAHAFITMYGEGDVAGVIELVKRVEEDSDEGQMSRWDVFCYQDPLDGMKTALHTAIERSQQEAVWLLLWMASNLPTSNFPEEVSQSAQSIGAAREGAGGRRPDIRSLRDVEGRKPRDIASSLTWTGSSMAGVLDERIL